MIAVIGRNRERKRCVASAKDIYTSSCTPRLLKLRVHGVSIGAASTYGTSSCIAWGGSSVTRTASTCTTVLSDCTRGGLGFQVNPSLEATPSMPSTAKAPGLIFSSSSSGRAFSEASGTESEAENVLKPPSSLASAPGRDSSSEAVWAVSTSDAALAATPRAIAATCDESSPVSSLPMVLA